MGGNRARQTDCKPPPVGANIIVYSVKRIWQLAMASLRGNNPLELVSAGTAVAADPGNSCRRTTPHSEVHVADGTTPMKIRGALLPLGMDIMEKNLWTSARSDWLVNSKDLENLVKRNGQGVKGANLSPQLAAALMKRVFLIDDNKERSKYFSNLKSWIKKLGDNAIKQAHKPHMDARRRALPSTFARQ